MVFRSCFIVLAALLSVVPAEAQPSTAQFKQVLEAQLQKLKPTGTSVRTVLFEEVRPGTPNGGFFPFQVTASIHDYGPGYPANRFYGATCVGKMDKRKFDMRKDDFGGWIVEGAMTVLGATCKDNPSEGVSSIPLNTLTGAPADKTPASPATPAPPTKETGSLYIGEYACYGGGRLMAGMGFHLKPGNKYEDVDGKRGGTY